MRWWYFLSGLSDGGNIPLSEKGSYHLLSGLTLVSIILAGLAGYFGADFLFNQLALSIFFGLFIGFILYNNLLFSIFNTGTRFSGWRAFLGLPFYLKLFFIGIIGLVLSNAFSLGVFQNSCKKGLKAEQEALISKLAVIIEKQQSKEKRDYLSQISQRKKEFEEMQRKKAVLQAELNHPDPTRSAKVQEIIRLRTERQLMELQYWEQEWQALNLPVITYYQNKIDGLEAEKRSELEKFRRDLESKKSVLMYLKVIHQEYPISKLMEFGFVVFMLLPLILRQLNPFFSRSLSFGFQKDAEKRLILSQYSLFKEVWQEEISRFGVEAEYPYHHETAPFPKEGAKVHKMASNKLSEYL